MTPFTGTFYIVVQRFYGKHVDPKNPFEAVISPERNQVDLDQIIREIRDGEYGKYDALNSNSIDWAQVIEVDLVKGTATDITKRVIELAEYAA